MGASDEGPARKDPGVTGALKTTAPVSSGVEEKPWPAQPPLFAGGAGYHGYVIKGEQGRGGLGRVLRAHDRWLDRPVALKEVLKQPVDPDVAARFLREARLTARLQHPSVVPVYEIGFRDDGAPYYAMKLIEGERFDRVIARAQSLAERMALLPNVLAVAEALAYAHDHGIIHRDVKPSNVLVGAFGETVLIDWGLAKDLRDPAKGEVRSAATPASGAPAVDPANVALSDTVVDLGLAPSGPRTREGAQVGTVAYMPPEQFRGGEVDERVDVFALGACLYQTTTGAAPYDGVSKEDALARIDRGEPIPIEQREPGVPLDVAAIVRKAMAKEPADRYPTAKELAADLRRFQTGQLVSARAYSPRALVGRWIEQHKKAVATGALFGAILAAVGALAVVRVVRERDRAEAASVTAQVAERRASDERRRAEARTKEVTLVQARTSLEKDPTASLAWLKTEKFGVEDWPEVASIAADARARGAARHVVPVREKDGVQSLAVSPDGTRVFVGLFDRGLDVVDIAGGKVEARLPTPSQLQRIALTSGGGHVVAGSDDGPIVSLDVRSGALALLSGHEGMSIVAVERAPERAVSCGDDRAVRAWDLAAGTSQVVATLRGACIAIAAGPQVGDFATVDGHRLSVWRAGHARTDGPRVFPLASGDEAEALAWTGGGRFLVVRDARRTLRALEVATGAWTALAEGGAADPVGERRAGAVAPRDERFATSDPDGSVRIWDLARGGAPPLTLRAHSARVESLAFSNDGERLVTCSQDGGVVLWDPRTGMGRTLRGHAGNVYDCVFAPDDQTLVSAGNDAAVRVWRLGAREKTLGPYGGHIHRLIVSADGARFAWPEGEHLHVWERGTDRVTSLEGHTKSVRGIGFLGTTRLGTVSLDGTGRLWDVGHGTSIVLRSDESSMQTFAAALDGSVAATGAADGVARIWRAEDGALLQTLHGPRATTTALAFSPDVTRLAVAHSDGTTRIWDARTGALLRALGEPGALISSIRFAEGGKRIVASSADGAARVWDPDSGALVRRLEGHTNVINSVAVSADGRRVVTASDDRTARVWDVETGASLVLRGHVDAVASASFAADDRYVITSSDDFTGRVWDARTGRLRLLVRTGARATEGRMTPDGALVAFGSYDRAVHVVHVDPDALFPDDVGAIGAWLDAQTTAHVGERGEVSSSTE